MEWTMVKKVVLGTLLVGLIGVLVAGAIIRTVDRTDNVAEARGLGQGNGRGEVEGYAVESTLQGAGQGRGGGGQGVGYGQAAGAVERQYPNYEDTPEEWVTYEGTVVQAPAAGEELVIATSAGEELVIGTGPGYMEAEGFALQAGEQVQVQGYWEDDELKAAQITRLRDGETIMLRDQLGRPAWSGSGKRAAEQAAVVPQRDQGQGQGGNGGQGQGQGGYGGEGRADAPGDGTGEGLAEVSAWLTLQGTVVSVDTSALVVQTAGGQEITVEGRTWMFAQENGFWANAGDPVTVVGFDEDGEFEIGQISNNTAGIVVQIREESGRPLWAGGGRRGG